MSSPESPATSSTAPNSDPSEVTTFHPGRISNQETGSPMPDSLIHWTIAPVVTPGSEVDDHLAGRHLRRGTRVVREVRLDPTGGGSGRFRRAGLGLVQADRCRARRGLDQVVRLEAVDGAQQAPDVALVLDQAIRKVLALVDAHGSVHLALLP